MLHLKSTATNLMVIVLTLILTIVGCSEKDNIIGPEPVPTVPLSCTIGGIQSSNGGSPRDVTCFATANGGSVPYQYSWEFGDNHSSSDSLATHSYTSDGDYQVSLMVTDADGMVCSKDTTIQVTSSASFTCQASADRTTGQAPLTVQFSCTASGGTLPYRYAWSFGDNSSSSIQSPSHTYTSAGTYTAEVTTSDATGMSTRYSVTIIVAGNASTLNCSASATPTTGAAPLSVSLSASGIQGTPPYSYRWQFGDGSSSTQQNPSHTYQTVGSYTANLMVTDASSDVCSKTVTISASQPPAAPSLTGPSNVAAGLSFSLTWDYTWPALATTGEKVVLERSTSGPTSGFSQVAEIPRGGSSRFVIANPSAGVYYYRARVRVGIIGYLTWSAYSTVVKVTINAPVSRTRFNNTGTYFIVSLKVDGIEQFPASPQGLLAGYYYEMELSPGTHTYEALFGSWSENGTREYLYQTTGSFVQRVGITETVALPGPTVYDLLTKFSSSGFWGAWIPGSFEKAGFRFFANGTYDFYVGDNLQTSGTYSFVSRNSTVWAVTFSDGTNQGVLYEYFGYFVMYNGPGGGALQYFYEGQ